MFKQLGSVHLYGKITLPQKNQNGFQKNLNTKDPLQLLTNFQRSEKF